MHNLGKAATNTAALINDAAFLLRIMLCKSNRQKRKIRHGLLFEARIDESLAMFYKPQDAAYVEFMADAANQRHKAGLVASAWKGFEFHIKFVKV